mgnify:CR=1 FL=1
MAYSVPSTAAGGILTDAIWNASVRDNILYLKDREDNPPRARLTHSTTQSLTDGALTAVAFDGEATDSAALHDTSTNNSRITIPTGEGGWWLFTGVVEFAANATGQRKLQFRTDGSANFGGMAVDAAASGVTQLAISFMLALTAGQYAELMASQNSGGALNLTTGVHFSAIRIA